MKSCNQMITDLDTPTLLVDIDRLKKNINKMTSFAKDNNVHLRPHIKTHKSIHIAKMQLDMGATGITVAKIGEAEVMVEAGINDILIAFPIANKTKISRVKKLINRGVSLKLAVDQIEQLRILQQAFANDSFELEVWIKVNSGLNRCGVEPGKDVLELAKEISMSKNVTLGGIFTHAGHSYASKSFEEIHNIGVYEGKAIAESAADCENIGIPVPIRSVGSTPTYQIAGKVEGVNEVRPGNAAFFDAIQVGLGVAKEEECALTLLASVVGVYKESRLVLDTGSKSLALDKGAHGNDTVKGFGKIVGHPDITLERLSEEHGVAIFPTRTELKLNDRVQIIPNHACTVANLFDHYVVHKNGRVMTTWPVDARGQVT
ncbi:D-serine deaminase-like pyridoxal phosphate-dependent protein [Salirhabdus euzebyi]|uniref:D-serine deaminase-like pyridoxal phosphate-dependent protein n=1 Tax=Salirhabdus euzebyi TaxID=394506 RepID=A0A841Q9E2_9BACI|nr:D-TA family PLP-dependent enzyme [Salirhabdus euzebyi]MBB6454923.1 D-serine deaminase-like pyridoxal phosphate-dependent protein [Salirhabdus euzebyi]